MISNVFTYGSLMFPQVWQRVVRGDYRSARAAVADHARYAIAGETYPGMVAQPGATVEGVLYFDVGVDDIAALDAFEGSAYRRGSIPATLDSGAVVTAAAYIYIASGLSDGPWLPEAFRLQHFLNTYCRDRTG